MRGRRSKPFEVRAPHAFKIEPPRRTDIGILLAPERFTTATMRRRRRGDRLEWSEKLKIAIIGSGRIGATAARLFVAAGHEIAIANSRGPESLRALINELGSNAHAMEKDDAAGFAAVVLLAVPWHMEEALPAPDVLRNKIVIDAMNPYNPAGGFFDLAGSTSSEIVLERMPGARLVKAFNTIYYEHLASRGRKDLPLEERHAIYIAGDNAEAKQIVAKLIKDIGFAPVDTGSLREGGKMQQPDSPVYNETCTAAQARALISSLASGARK